MALPLLHTMSRNISVDAIKAGRRPGFVCEKCFSNQSGFLKSSKLSGRELLLYSPVFYPFTLLTSLETTQIVETSFLSMSSTNDKTPAWTPLCWVFRYKNIRIHGMSGNMNPKQPWQKVSDAIQNPSCEKGDCAFFKLFGFKSPSGRNQG